MASSSQSSFQPVATIHTGDIPITNPHNLAAVYSNNFGVSATMTDFTLYFLEVGQTPGEKGPAQKQEVKAVVTLPLAAAAGLQSLMHQVLAQAPEMIKQAKAKSGGKE